MRIDNADGTWSYPERYHEGSYVTGAFTWHYVGQARVNWNRYPESVPSRTFETPPVQLIDDLIGMLMVDEDGAEWVLVEVGEDLLDPELVRDAAASVTAWEEPPPNAPEFDGYWVKGNYTVIDICDGDQSTDDIRLWGQESRSKKTAPFSGRQETAVFVGEDTACSGALLLDRWVITNAHCLKDDNGNWDVSATDITLYDVHGNPVGAQQLFSTSAYTSSGDWGDDWAMIKMLSPFPSAPENMDLWAGPDSDFKDINDNVHNLAFPSWTWDAPFCIDNDDGSAAHQAELYHQANAEASSTTSKRVKWKSDNGPRASGSPYYFCPDGADEVCAGGDKAEIVGLHAGFWTNGFSSRHIGPKASHFRPTVISIIQSN